LSITGTTFQATGNEVKIKLGDLVLNDDLESPTSVLASFEKYPKPGTPSLEVQFKDGTSYRIAKITASAVIIPLTATISSSVTTGFEGQSVLTLQGNGIRELALDDKLSILICGAFKCNPDLETAPAND